MKKAAQTIKAHASGILNYFVAPVSNGLLARIMHEKRKRSTLCILVVNHNKPTEVLP
jgi:hypothetical protein